MQDTKAGCRLSPATRHLPFPSSEAFPCTSVALQYIEFFYTEDDERLDQVAQRAGRCPIPGKLQGQAGWALGNLI